ncbi:hypothetical protein SaccyDRAFT_1448 [Saccharomonospora cyanea NA-134]|uniref:Uncharacterized protein n=1 Tax=Saccharomonospora cyanea NA-134 TaxID=882082 RepID=H5XEA6_9PSEU|nr:hypothetical protein SaccyDRAFT_1448 [Saccharomonospora cyanea NA-134]
MLLAEADRVRVSRRMLGGRVSENFVLLAEADRVRVSRITEEAV